MPSRRRGPPPNSPAVRRMPVYLHWLLRMRELGKRTVSTTELADGLGIDWMAVRKDIALTGVCGRPRVGYNVDRLVAAIRAFLDWRETRAAALFGTGPLGTAVLECGELDACRLRIDAVFDPDPAKAGTEILGHAVLPLSRLPAAFRERRPEIAILCVPAGTAQSVAELAVRHGVRCVWNFASVALDLPAGVVVQNDTISAGYAMLSVKLRNARAGRRPIDE